MDDNWPYKFRRTLLDLQTAYKISDWDIINSLSDAANGYNVRSRKADFTWCKIRIVFENSVHRELPFHSSCYRILGDIIEDETKKYHDGLGLPKEDFLLKLDVLFQLISFVERDWKDRKRSQQEFANYFNDLVRKEKRMISTNKATALYDGFLRRWNKLYNPQRKSESSVDTSLLPKRKRDISLSPKRKRRIISDIDQPTPPPAPDNTNILTSRTRTSSSSTIEVNPPAPSSPIEFEFSLYPFTRQDLDNLPRPCSEILDKDWDKDFIPSE